MTGVVNSQLTLEAFLKLPERKPASKFVGGRIEQKSMSQGKHSRLQLKFCDAVNDVAEAAQIAMALHVPCGKPSCGCLWQSINCARCGWVYLEPGAV